MSPLTPQDADLRDAVLDRGAPLRQRRGMAKAITLLWGRETLANRDYVGVGLKLLDGGWSYEQLMAAAIDLVVGPNASNAQVASRLAGSGSVYESLLNNGQISKGSLGVLIAEGAGNLQRVDLVGLQASGLEYL